MNMKWTVEFVLCAKEVNGFAYVVVYAVWKCEATDGGYTKLRVGRVELQQPGQNFVAFENLDEQTVLNWCWSIIDKSAVEAVVKSEIDAETSNPIQPAPLPWNS